ncbi:hypothetical protein J2Y74_004469 [Pseudomonas migulae]|jgi:hypothetical protein|nr:hypothetical protein [Pseudomonas migulae]
MSDAEFEEFFSEVQRSGTVQPVFGGGAKR